ncbi:MAG: hypothetical protein LC664_16065 [Flavobacteriales bacterium]|nr:hypothetical protein [Flavobacteriales bacterium]
MWKAALLFLLFLHGVIHLMGFVKAFDFAEIQQLNLPISRVYGVFWLVAAALFVASGMCLWLKWPYWFVFAFAGAVASQILIISIWSDARFGTIANLLILIGAIAGYGMWNFESQFKNDLREAFEKSAGMQESVSHRSIDDLPDLIADYIRFTNPKGMPRIENMAVEFDGAMREKGRDWFPFRAQQVSFFDEPTRLFFMEAKMFGVPVLGYHRYMNGDASMDIRILGLIPVAHISGQVMREAETVTVFNDICLMAPAALTDKRITWDEIDSTRVRASFVNEGTTISAELIFNDSGQLVNFVSDDRTAVADMKKYRFSTPVSEYKLHGEIRVLTQGEAVWHYPEGAFAYGKFHIKRLEYNVSGDRFGLD